MKERGRDPALDTLLDLHGETLFVDGSGHWVRFMVVQTEETLERPHGLRYSLTLHAPDGSRLVGYDNAHQVVARQRFAIQRRRTFDHRHRLHTTRPYDYKDAATLLRDFWSEVDAVLRKQEVSP